MAFAFFEAPSAPINTVLWSAYGQTKGLYWHERDQKYIF